MSDYIDREDFLRQLSARLEKGEREYGNKSFERSFDDLADELLQEYLDIAGWAYIQWAKARKKLYAIQEGVDSFCSDGGSDA